MKEIQLILAHNVFANVDKCLRVFLRLISGFESTFRFSFLNASVGAANVVIPGGPERSAGSLGIAIMDCASGAYSVDSLSRCVKSSCSVPKFSLDRYEIDKTVYRNNCTLNNDPELGK